MIRYELFGNKKNISSINGKINLSEEMEKEFIEIGIIPKDGIGKYLINEKGEKISYIKENEKEISRIFQYHIPKEEWGKTFNLISEKFIDGREGRIKIIYIPNKNRMEIWENEKGEKRKMIMRKENDFSDIIKEWNKIQNENISLENLLERIG